MNKRLLKKIPVHSADDNILSVAKHLRESNLEYIISGKTENDILILDFFEIKRLINGVIAPFIRVFLTDGDYITQSFDCGKCKWRIGSIGYILPYKFDSKCGGYWYNRTCFADNETLSSIQQFVCVSDEYPLKAVNEMQQKIMKSRLDKKHQVIKDRIDDKMRLINDIPDDFEDWIDETGFGSKRYFFYRYKNWKYKNGFCTVCKSDVKIENPRHNQDGLCPKCGAKIIFKAESRSGNVSDSRDVSLFQKTRTVSR